MDDRPPNRIACLFPGVKRKLRSVPAEVTVCLRDFPPAMMVPHESRRNTRPGPGCRIFFRPQSLRHCGDARPASALRSSPPAAELAGAFSSLGAGNVQRALPAGIPCGEDLLAVWLTWMATVHPFATTIIVTALVALCAFLLYYLFRFARRALQRLFAT